MLLSEVSPDLSEEFEMPLSSKSDLANSCNKMSQTLDFFLFPIESEKYHNLIFIFIFYQVKKIKWLKF